MGQVVGLREGAHACEGVGLRPGEGQLDQEGEVEMDQEGVDLVEVGVDQEVGHNLEEVGQEVMGQVVVGQTDQEIAQEEVGGPLYQGGLKGVGLILDQEVGGQEDLEDQGDLGEDGEDSAFHQGSVEVELQAQQIQESDLPLALQDLESVRDLYPGENHCEHQHLEDQPFLLPTSALTECSSVTAFRTD